MLLLVLLHLVLQRLYLGLLVLVVLESHVSLLQLPIELVVLFLEHIEPQIEVLSDRRDLRVDINHGRRALLALLPTRVDSEALGTPGR